MKAIIAFLFSGLALAVVMTHSAAAQEQSFEAWLEGARQEAIEKGISPNIVMRALHDDIKPIPRIIELDRKQPEGQVTFATYRERIVNSTRINQGRVMMERHRDLLNQVSARYNVQPQYIVALWGIETNYGGFTGGYDVVNALATLAYDGRRGAFFRAELMNALQILDEGHIAPEDMKGSWAGAMGQSQFMPSSFINFAVDFDGDGRRDIWGTHADVFASAANYLAKSGWNGDERWGRLVEVPHNLSRDHFGLEVKKPLSEWQRLGVRRANGRDLPTVGDMQASLVQPDGAGNSAYLVYDNFRTIMKWNRSTYFATSVGLLADAISY